MLGQMYIVLLALRMQCRGKPGSLSLTTKGKKGSERINCFLEILNHFHSEPYR